MKPNLKWSILCIVAASILFGDHSLSAQPIVMTTGQWAPYTSQDSQNQGFITEIISAVFKVMGKEYQVQFHSWKECERLVQNGTVWAAFPYEYKEFRTGLFTFSDVLAHSKTVFIYYNDDMKDVEWENLDDLKPYKIGGVRGYFFEKELQRSGLNVEYTQHELKGIKNLINHQIDLMITDELVGMALIKQNFPADVGHFGVLKKVYSQKGLRLMVNKHNLDSLKILDQFNGALKAIRMNGQYQQLLNKYHLSN